MANPKGKVELPSYDPEYKLRIIKTALEKKLNAPDIKQAYGLSQMLSLRNVLRFMHR